MDNAQPEPSQDTSHPAGVPRHDGTLAGIVHLLWFAQTIGQAAGIIVWATRGRQDRVTAFQCAQAVLLHVFLMLLGVVLTGLVLVGWVVALIIAANWSWVEPSERHGAWPVFVALWLVVGAFAL